MFGSHANATAFATARGLQAWPVDQTAGEALLLRASEALDGAYALTFDRTAVPDAIANATYRLGLLMATNAAALDAAQSQPIERVKAGSVEVQYSDTAPQLSTASLAYHAEVRAFLRGYITASTSGIKLRRA